MAGIQPPALTANNQTFWPLCECISFVYFHINHSQFYIFYWLAFGNKKRDMTS